MYFVAVEWFALTAIVFAQGGLFRPNPVPGTHSFEVSNGVSAPILKSFVAPVYPPEALQAHRGGTVLLYVVIRPDGRPVQTILVKEPTYKDMALAAIDAVRKWRFEPAKRTGQNVPVHLDILINFDSEHGTTGASLP